MVQCMSVKEIHLLDFDTIIRNTCRLNEVQYTHWALILPKPVGGGQDEDQGQGLTE